MASLGCPNAMPTARATPPMLIIMSPGRLELPWNWMEWRLRHCNQTGRGAHEATNRLRVWLLAASLASRRWCRPSSPTCATVQSVSATTGLPTNLECQRSYLGRLPSNVAVGTRQQQKGPGVPGSIFSSDWLVLRLQRADPRMPDAQCAWRAWLRLLSDNLVRSSAYVISSVDD